jgi:hypothetical protein
MKSEIRWVTPTYPALHHVLTNPVYAGACAYGKSRHQRYVDERGMLRRRTRHVAMAEWSVLLPEHHPGFIDWATSQANQARIDTNIHPQPHQAGAAVREGAPLLQGRATRRKCGRRLHTHYRGRNSSPGYHCSGKIIVQGRGVYCLNVGGVQIDQVVVEAFLRAVTPAAVEATRLAIQAPTSWPVLTRYDENPRIHFAGSGSTPAAHRAGAGRHGLLHGFRARYLGRFDPSTGRLLKEWFSPGGSDSEPFGIAITSDGEVWCSESGVKPNTVVRFDPKSGSFSTKPIPSGGGVVRNMVATPDRELYLACSGVNKVAVVSLNR